jgi:polysaccharide biosynthesis protein PslG
MGSLVARTLLLLTLVLTGSVIFAVLRLHPFSARPALVPTPEAIPGSYFGMTLHNYHTTTPWPSIPFASLRTWDTDVNWADIQQSPNTYIWSNLDALIDLAQRRGVDLVFTLGRTPRWASASPDTKSPYGPGQCAPPANMQYWDEFLRAVVTHAGGKIRFWETWNEPQDPDSEVYCGDVSTMVELQRRAYEIIKAIDPTAMILTPAPVGGYGPPWMSRFLAGGGGKYADIMAFHGYLAPDADAESIIPTITKFKAVFAEHGQDTKPVWDTEAGWGKNPWLSDPDLQAAFLAKFYLLHWSAGVERFYWYAYDNPTWGTLWDAKNGLHKAGIAYREIHKWLQGATMTAPCASDQTVWTCNLVRKNGYRAIVLWNSAKVSTAATHISVPDEFRQYRDLDGNLQRIAADGVAISSKPILVETATAF